MDVWIVFSYFEQHPAWELLSALSWQTIINIKGDILARPWATEVSLSSTAVFPSNFAAHYSLVLILRILTEALGIYLPSV